MGCKTVGSLGGRPGFRVLAAQFLGLPDFRRVIYNTG